MTSTDAAGRRVERLRLALRLVLFVFYFGAGILHIVASAGFAAIVPPLIPFPVAVVVFTGLCELAGAVGLLWRPTRWWAGLLLGIYAVCVWPANIYQALWHVHVPPLPDSWWYHGPRLVLQPVIIWWAWFAGGVVQWPFRRK